MIEVVGNVLVVLTCVGAITFCVLYALSSPWFSSAIGRNMMAMMGTIGLFLILAIIKMVRPDAFNDLPWIRPVAWTLIGGIVWWRVVLLVRTQILRRRDSQPSK